MDPLSFILSIFLGRALAPDPPKPAPPPAVTAPAPSVRPLWPSLQ